MWMKKSLICFSLLLGLLLNMGMTIFASDYNSTPLTITGRDTTLRVVNGSVAATTVEIVNTGSAPIPDLTLWAELPYKWLLESVTPETLVLNGGESGTFMLTFTVPSSQNAITHTLKLTCGNGTIRSEPLSIPVAVSTNMGYLWFIFGGVTICGFLTVIYFKNHGRR